MLAETFGLGFIIGLTGAVPPGPMLVVVIESSLKHGWQAGPLAVLGHVFVETAILFVIALGFTSIVSAQELSKPVGIIGGLVLVCFGILTIWKMKSSASLENGKKARYRNLSTISAGALSSMSNPYFWLWWLTVGTMLVVSTLSFGIIGAVLFIAGHWCADLAWYSAVSISLYHGKKVLTPGTIKIALVSCGIFMVLFGAWFFIGAAFYPQSA